MRSELTTRDQTLTQLQASQKTLQGTYKALQGDYKAMQADYKSLESDYKSLQTENKTLQAQVTSLKQSNENPSSLGGPFMRETSSIVNNTDRDRDQRNRNKNSILSMAYSVNNSHNTSVNKSRSEIMIDEVSLNGGKQMLTPTSKKTAEFAQENVKLRKSLERAVKRAAIWQTRFYEIKDKIFRQTQKMTDEVNFAKKHFQEKMRVYFTKYTRLLKEIVVNNSEVSNYFEIVLSSFLSSFR